MLGISVPQGPQDFLDLGEPGASCSRKPLPRHQWRRRWLVLAQPQEQWPKLLHDLVEFDSDFPQPIQFAVDQRY